MNALEASYSRTHNVVRIDYETDLAAAAVIYIDPFELIFDREFRVRAVRRAFRTVNLRKPCYNLETKAHSLDRDDSPRRASPPLIRFLYSLDAIRFSFCSQKFDFIDTLTILTN